MLGYELKSTAVCTHLQRQSDGVFTYEDPHTLLGRQVNTNNVINSIKYCKSLLDESVLNRKDYFESYISRLKDVQVPILEAGNEYQQHNDDDTDADNKIYSQDANLR